MTTHLRDKAEKILQSLSKQSFDDFYRGRLYNYIVGVTEEKEKEEILQEIAFIFRLDSE